MQLKEIVVSHTITDGDLINAVTKPDLKVKLLRTNLQMKKSSQREFLGPELPTRILSF